MRAKVNMLERNEGKVILKLVLPMIAGALGIVLFNLADTYFVGKLGTKQLAAMGFSFPIVLVTGSLASGIGIGASSSIAQSLGAGNRQKARRIVTDAHTLSIAFTLTLGVLGIITIEPFFTLLGAEPDVMPYIRTYMTIWYAGIPFVVLPMVGQNIIQAEGDTRIPGLLLASSVTLNIIMDPLLIFGYGPFPELGIAGAAYATVIARGSIVVATLVILWKRDHLFSSQIPELRKTLASWWHIMYIGIPATIMNVIIPISQGVVTRLVSDFGTEEVAGFGVATRIESFALVFIIAMSMIVTPFIGQNFGANKIQRVWRGFRYSSLYSLIWGLIAFSLVIPFARPLASVFNEEPRVIEVTAAYLLIVSVTYGFQGIVTIATASFNGLRKPIQAAGASMIRLFALYIPLAVIGKYIYGLEGIFFGAAAANLISGIIAYYWFKKHLNRYRQQTNTENHLFDPEKAEEALSLKKSR
jgi:putative MATE family efflux protein